MSFDAWLGMLVHITPLIAVRPEIALYISKGDHTDLLTPASNEHPEGGAIGGSLGIFFFLPRKQNFFLYFGPEVEYFHLSQLAFFDNGDKKDDYEIQMTSIAALVGAQYMFSDRFGFQGDIGLAYIMTSSHDESWNNVGTKTTNRKDEDTGIYTRGAYLGAVFYFN